MVKTPSICHINSQPTVDWSESLEVRQFSPARLLGFHGFPIFSHKNQAWDPFVKVTWNGKWLKLQRFSGLLDLGSGYVGMPW